MKIYRFAPLLVAMLLPAPARAGTVRLISPYIGTLTHDYAAANMPRLKDSGEMDGIYAQWIDTDKFQANVFYYRAPGINYSLVKGLHLNADYYMAPSPSGKYVAGAGLEDLDVDMSAGGHIPGLLAADVNNDVLFYFLRAGRYFYFGGGPLRVSLLPYAGYAHESVTGNVRLDPPGPALVVSDMDDKDDHPLAGLNLDLVFARFADLQAKWMGRFKDGERLDEYSLMANIYLDRHWGLSYRYKSMQYGSGSVKYNMAGLVYCF